MFRLEAGVNDSVETATELAELIQRWGRNYHVNLIPYNPIEGSEFKRPSKRAVFIYLNRVFLACNFGDSKVGALFKSLKVSAFVAALESRKVTVSVRQTRGLEANAACGQLRNEFQKSPLLNDSENAESQPEVATDVELEDTPSADLALTT